ncbi:MAG: hypothetical protein U7126_04325 [Microcoleus sp.]
MYDWPSVDSEEPGWPDEFHDLEPLLLTFTSPPPTHPPEQIFSAGDLNFYEDVRDRNWYKHSE